VFTEKYKLAGESMLRPQKFYNPAATSSLFRILLWAKRDLPFVVTKSTFSFAPWNSSERHLRIIHFQGTSFAQKYLSQKYFAVNIL